jgi:hypothetical protein
MRLASQSNASTRPHPDWTATGFDRRDGLARILRRPCWSLRPRRYRPGLGSQCDEVTTEERQRGRPVAHDEPIVALLRAVGSYQGDVHSIAVHPQSEK